MEMERLLRWVNVGRTNYISTAPKKGNTRQGQYSPGAFLFGNQPGSALRNSVIIVTLPCIVNAEHVQMVRLSTMQKRRYICLKDNRTVISPSLRLLLCDNQPIFFVLSMLP
jgi:hypothetical protein